MDLQREVVFCYLEEDNAQNVYFRVIPLLTAGGDVREEARQAWPDNGALRIIPDRNEQFTFKDRMRAMGSWCAMDLTPFPEDANKIRTNKNYRPEHEETNRFIVFSDTVRPLEEAPFFEVLGGKPEDAAQLAAGAITPRFFVLDGDTLYGPVERANPAVPQASEPMEASLVTAELPDGREHTLLCLLPQEAEASAEPEAQLESDAEPKTKPEPSSGKRKKAREDLPIGENLEILDTGKTFEETLTSLSQPLPDGANLLQEKPQEHADAKAVAARDTRKLSGTALRRTGVQTSVPAPRNHVQEVVSSRLQVLRSADPPAEPVAFSTDLKAVENPVETAMAAIRRAWAITDTRPRLISLLYSLEGFQRTLEACAPCAQLKEEDALARMEEERLRLLVELDQAKADMAAFRAKSIAEASARARKELESLRREEAELRSQLESLRAAVGPVDEPAPDPVKEPEQEAEKEPAPEQTGASPEV